ncbi:hypothetical protein QYF50_06995 [Paenibacillus vini]|uniref:hypothetical protein n=1 Tax=Paenibacillus vini TaxID=1476024 RepID=UPI0025B68582|nr:hypothetical protein [Paenibacillus vini]MDN4067638.1 hypothetical protein [Paenibacillus vini]
MNPLISAVISPVLKSLSSKFVSIVTNSKAFRDIKASWSKDNYAQKTLNIFSAAIADAKALIKLPDELIVELLEDPDNRKEIFRWILEGVEPDQLNKDQLVLEPYIERYPTQQDKMVPFFSIILTKLNEYKIIHWDPSDLELINRIARLEKGIDLIDHKQDQAIELSKEINQKVDEIKALAFDPNITFLAQMLSMIQSNDIQSAEKQLASIIRMLSNAHDNQDWSYNVSLDGSEVTILEKPQNDNIIQKLEKRMDVKVVIPDIYKHFKNFGEIIQYGRNKQIPIELELQEFKMYAGNHLIERHKSTLKDKLILKIPPIPFPNLEAKLLIGDDIIVEVWIQIIEVIDDNLIVVSNKNQPAREFEYNFTYNLKTNESSKFQFRIPPEKKRSVKANLLFFKSIKNAIMGTSIRMVDATNTTCFSAKIINSNLEESDDRLIQVLEMLSNIETFFDVTFELPDQTEADEIIEISELNRIISTNKEAGDLDEYTTMSGDFELINKCIDSLEAGNPILFKGEKVREFTISNFTFVVETEIELPPSGIKDLDKLKNKIKVFSEGDSIKLTFVPFDENNKTITSHNSKFSYRKNSLQME